MTVMNAIKKNTGAFILVALAYAAIYFLNNSLTGFLYVLPAAHLVHIPSGFKFLFVMIARWGAALAIAFVSFINAYFVMFQGDALLDFQLACASGLAPLLTWLFFKYQLHIDENLGNITFRQILIMGVFFALLNSSLHQMVLFWSGRQSDFTQGLFVMAVGDITGLYIVMLFIRLGMKILSKVKVTK
jgi:hypothetical protein